MMAEDVALCPEPRTPVAQVCSCHLKPRSKKKCLRSNMNIGGVVFPLEQQSRDEDSVVYHGVYVTEGVPHTKSGDRQPVQVSIEVSPPNLSSGS